MSKAFDEAVRLSKQKPMDKDIIQKFDELRIDIELSEVDDFDWLYEAAAIELELD